MPCEVGIGACVNRGVIICDGFGGQECSVDPYAPQTERCGDQVDNNCNGDVDEGFLTLGNSCDATGETLAIARGETFANVESDPDQCLNDMIRCVEGAASCVKVTTAVETCDGVDNDCNDGIDEDFTFATSLTPVTYIPINGACDSADAGTCARGKVVCAGPNTVTCQETGIDPDTIACSAGIGECKVDGHLTCASVCDAEALSATGRLERCGDDLDSNCNGVNDDGFEVIGEPCDADDSNATILVDTDRCLNDVVVCNEDDNTTTACEPRNYFVETCNGRDDNCDGSADEIFTYTQLPGGASLAIGKACDSLDEGSCSRGVVECNGPNGDAAICNETGIDPDTIACSAGIGECKVDGHLTCDSVCDVQALSATGRLERCGDDLDSNCNGVNDDGFELIGEPCDADDSNATILVDTDRCLNDAIVCNEDDNTTTACEPRSYAVETCNGRDDNCDGSADEIFTYTQLPSGASLAIGKACDGLDEGSCSRGLVECNGPNGDAAICNETGFDPTSVTCSAGVGVCKVDGHLTCASVCDAVALSASGRVERCGNNTDDDCDGSNDDGFELIGEPCDADDTNATILVDSDECENDEIVCNPDDNATTVCEPRNYFVETCNGRDDNCDGRADEGFTYLGIALGERCDGSDSDLCLGGIVVCMDGIAGCDDNDASATEACNGIDDDCDSRTDEDWKPWHITENPDGNETSTGPYLQDDCDGSNDADTCKEGKVECNLAFNGIYCHEIGLGRIETCDGVDNTCEGNTDEGFDIGLACLTDDLGVCKVPGFIECDAINDPTTPDDDNTTSICVATTPVAPTAETCNALDDDCDGVTDDAAGSVNASSVCKPLETDIVTGPPAITALTTATFTYVNPLATPLASHTTFECSLDGGLWVVCNHVGGGLPSLTCTNLVPWPAHAAHARHPWRWCGRPDAGLLDLDHRPRRCPTP